LRNQAEIWFHLVMVSATNFRFHHLSAHHSRQNIEKGSACWGSTILFLNRAEFGPTMVIVDLALRVKQLKAAPSGNAAF